MKKSFAKLHTILHTIFLKNYKLFKNSKAHKTLTNKDLYTIIYL